MRLVLLFASITLVFSSSILASTEIWKMGDHFFEFERGEKSGLLISKSCLKRNCEASRILKTISFKKMGAHHLSGGKNPGAVLCHQLKNAQVVILRDLKGNDNSFCMFSDKSFVSSGSLDAKARMNDEK